jgi:hypothetical protein
MNSPKRASSSEEVRAGAITAEKRVILSMGGKGGVGKTSVMVGLPEWFDANQIRSSCSTSTPKTRRGDH